MYSISTYSYIKKDLSTENIFQNMVKTVHLLEWK